MQELVSREIRASELLIEGLFPKKVYAAVSELNGKIEDLYPEEAAIISDTVCKRKAEFATGRLCAKQALLKCGVTNFPVLMDSNRAPLWPENYVGSITHTNHYCAAVVGSVGDKLAIGLDLEEDSRLKKRIWPTVFVSDEIAWLFLLEDEEEPSAKWATLMFAAKEAFYKAQYPLTHAWVGFKDVKVDVNFEKKSFTVTLMRNIPLFWEKNKQFHGRYTFFDDLVATGVWIDFQNAI